MIATPLRWLRIVSLLVVILLPIHPQPAAQAGPPDPAHPRVTGAERHDQSRPLRELAADLTPEGDQPGFEMPFLPLPKGLRVSSRQTDTAGDLLSPNATTTGSMPAPTIQWEGVRNLSFVVPPDTNGDVGPNHYVQWVNLRLAVWDKQGHLLMAPVAGNVIWQGFGGQCELHNNGDPQVLYDPLADRWLIGQFALPSGGPYYECIAISASSDPTGTWNRYAFQWSQTKMNDYPKFGVWPDGYYMTVNQFDGPGLANWAGAGVAVFERDRMLQNQPARMISFDLESVNTNFGGMLPADLDGRQAPPPGAPNLFMEWDDSTTFDDPSDSLRLWEFHTDWLNPLQTTFGLNRQPNAILPTANVKTSSLIPNWITQKGSSRGLDPISDRLMHRLQYRNFGGYQTLVGNHTVDIGVASPQAGIHWFEIRKTAGGSWGLFQDGVFASLDGNHRWMGSAAMDGSGDIALGYSLSGTNMYPSVAYAGRLPADQPGSLAQGEALMIAGSNPQTSASRWGDYSMLAVDPTDECTFWYTQEYYDATPGFGSDWRTRIGAFKFPSCAQPDTGLLQGTVRSALGNLPVSGAKVDLGGTSVFTGADGAYQVTLPAGPVNVQISAFGFLPQTGSGVISKGGTTRLDFSLAAAPMAIVSGRVSDGAGHSGMGLYAQIDIPELPSSPIFTDPASGQYQVALEQGVSYSFTVNASGYLPAPLVVTPPPGGMVQNFALQPDPAACPLGYQSQVGVCQLLAGGLVVGLVQDGNNPPNAVPKPLPGATVSDAASGTQAVAATSPAGTYFLFTPAGDRTLTAAYPGYTSVTAQPVTVLANGVVSQNFNLPAGYFQVAPAAVNLTVDFLAPTASTVLNFNNLGSAPATFTLAENSGPLPDLQPTGPFAPAGRRLSPKRLAELDARNIYDYVAPSVPVWPEAGEIESSWPVALTAPWGIGVSDDGKVWVGDALSGGGDGHDHLYNQDGSSLGQAIATNWGGFFNADLAVDSRNGRLWQVNVGGDNCIYEINPQIAAPTGARICPAFGNSQRGLAFDPLSRTFYSGTWNDAILSHFDRAGRLLDSVNTGINIAGLAYQPLSGHLFVLSNASLGYDIYVLDARNGYAMLGGFDIPGLADYGQAGLEMTEDGHLWVVDSVIHRVLEVTSGESGFSALVDVPWLSESIPGASVASGGSQAVTINMDATGLARGSYPAYLSVTSDTPYDNTTASVPPIPVNLTVANVRAVGLAPANQLGAAVAGRTHAFSITVTNTGDAQDTYSVSLGAHTWTVSAPATVGLINTGKTANLIIQVTVPLGTAIGQSETMVVSVAPTAFPIRAQSVTIKTVSAIPYYFPVIGK